MTRILNEVSGDITAKNYITEEQLSSTKEVLKDGWTIREVGNGKPLLLLKWLRDIPKNLGWL